MLIELNYLLTEKDLLAYHDYIYKNILHKRRPMIIWSLYGVFVLFLIYAEFNYPSDPGRYFVFGIVSLIAFLMLVIPIQRSRNALLSAIGETPEVIGEMKVVVKGKSLTLTTPAASQKYRLSDFTGHAITKSHIFIFAGESSSIIIPKTAFSSGTQMQQLIAAL